MSMMHRNFMMTFYTNSFWNLKFHAIALHTLSGRNHNVSSFVTSHFVNFLFNYVSLDVTFLKTVFDPFQVFVSAQLLLKSFWIMQRHLFRALSLHWTQSVEVFQNLWCDASRKLRRLWVHLRSFFTIKDISIHKIAASMW